LGTFPICLVSDFSGKDNHPNVPARQLPAFAAFGSGPELAWLGFLRRFEPSMIAAPQPDT
jgi:hypothetical protein